MEVSQSTFDSFILVAIQQFFNAGNIYHGNNGVSRFRLTTREDIITKLIPHFNNYPVSGFKELQYSIWLEILNVLESEILEKQTKEEVLINKLSEL
jgi:hypothetical protein